METIGVRTVKLKFLGHDPEHVGIPKADEKTGGGNERYLGYDPGLKRDLTVNKGETVVVSEEKAEQLERDGHGQWERVGSKERAQAQG